MYNYMLRSHCANYNGTNYIQPKQLILMLFSFCGFLFVDSNPIYAQNEFLSFPTGDHYSQVARSWRKNKFNRK